MCSWVSPEKVKHLNFSVLRQEMAQNSSVKCNHFIFFTLRPFQKFGDRIPLFLMPVAVLKSCIICEESTWFKSFCIDRCNASKKIKTSS